MGLAGSSNIGGRSIGGSEGDKTTDWDFRLGGRTVSLGTRRVPMNGYGKWTCTFPEVERARRRIGGRGAPLELGGNVTATSSSRDTTSIQARGTPETLMAASIFPRGENSFRFGRSEDPGTEIEVPDEEADGSEAASDAASDSLPVLSERTWSGASEVLMFHEPVISARSRFTVRKFDAGAENGEGGDRMPGLRGGGSGGLSVGDNGAYGGGASGSGGTGLGPRGDLASSESMITMSLRIPNKPNSRQSRLRSSKRGSDTRGSCQTDRRALAGTYDTSRGRFPRTCSLAPQSHHTLSHTFP